MGEQDIHDMRGEIAGVRADIRALSSKVEAGFERMDGRVRKTEEALRDAVVREDERSKLEAAGNMVRRPSILRDSRTYAVGGIGTAIAMIVIEFLKTLAANGPK
jgi:hypothetical protein